MSAIRWLKEVSVFAVVRDQISGGWDRSALKTLRFC